MELIAPAVIWLWIMTAAIVLGCAVIWRATRSIQLTLALVLVYYYSLAGAWKIIAIKLTGEENPALDHLESSLFPISVDRNYLLTISIYAIFMLGLILALYLMTKNVVSSSNRGSEALDSLRMTHPLVLILSIGALALSAALIWYAIASAVSRGVSAYAVSRGDVDQYWTIHLLLNRIGVDALAIGMVACLRESRRGFWLFCYVVVAATWTVFLGVLGDRNALLVGGLGGVLWYYTLGGRLGAARAVVIGGSGFFVLRLIESTRGWGVAGIASNIGNLLQSGDFWNPLALATGSESMAAHISLYGILSKHLGLTYGSSLLYIVDSLIPRLVSSDRVADSYTIYANAVGAPSTQGFNIHYAAGWYLNFGLLGVLAGAAILGAIWATLYRGTRRCGIHDARAVIATLAAFCFCCAYTPALIRAGPEGLKGLLFEGIIVPYILTWSFIRPRGSRARSVRLLPAELG